MTITAIIPFFSGHDTAKSIQWLGATMGSVRFADTTIVGVQSDEDYRIVFGLLKFHNVRKLDCSPMLLPVNLLRWYQETWRRDELVFFTEADQIFHGDIAELTTAIERDRNIVFAPHRAVQIQGNEPADWWGWGHWDHDAKRHRYLYERFTHEGREYVVHNKPHVLDTTGLHLHPANDSSSYHFAMRSQVIDNAWYTNSNACFAFGASWLMHADTFRRVEFKDQTQYPLEESSFAVHRTPGVTMLKSLNNQRFWVDHLSHRIGNQSTWK